MSLAIGSRCAGAALAILATLSTPALSRAGFPTPSSIFSIVPTHIALVGHSGGVPDPGGSFEVLVRSNQNDPLPNSVVTIDFIDVTDARLSSDVFNSGSVVDCPTVKISGVTDVTGRVNFSIVGAAVSGAAQCFASGSPCNGRARVYADGVLLREPLVSMFDLDGSSGIAGGDLSIWLDDFGSTLNPLRSDFSGDQLVNGSDLSLWLTRYGSSGSTQSGASYCP